MTSKEILKEHSINMMIVKKELTKIIKEIEDRGETVHCLDEMSVMTGLNDDRVATIFVVCNERAINGDTAIYDIYKYEIRKLMNNNTLGKLKYVHVSQKTSDAVRLGRD